MYFRLQIVAPRSLSAAEPGLYSSDPSGVMRECRRTDFVHFPPYPDRRNHGTAGTQSARSLPGAPTLVLITPCCVEPRQAFHGCPLPVRGLRDGKSRSRVVPISSGKEEVVARTDIGGPPPDGHPDYLYRGFRHCTNHLHILLNT